MSMVAEIGLLTFWEASDGEHEQGGPATSSLNGAAATLSAQGNALANRAYNCAAIIVASEGARDEAKFPLAPVSLPPTELTPVPAPPPLALAAAAPEPAALSIVKLQPLQLKAEEWGTAQIKVSNLGGTTTAPAKLKVRAPKYLVVKPKSGTLKLPALAPGQTKTASFRVKLTELAKAKSTLSLTATAGTLAANGSLVVKRTA